MPKAYIDVETGKVIENKIIEIKDNKIINIVDSKNYKKKVIKTETYLLPSFFDCHAHLFLTQTKEDKSLENALLREASLSDNLRYERAKEFLKDYIYNGFGHVCDLGNSSQFLDVKLKSEISSNSNYPVLFVSGPGLATYMGQFSKNANLEKVKKEYSIIDEKTDIRKLLNIYLDKKVDILKIYLDNSPGIGGMEDDILLKILSSEESKKFKKITFHAVMPISIQKIEKFKMKNFEHVAQWEFNRPINTEIFYNVSDLDEKVLKEFNYYNPPFYQFQKMRAKKMAEAKVKLVFGPDFYFSSSNNQKRIDYILGQISFLSNVGFSSINIIQALTINPARSLKVGNTIGKICIGCEASLVGIPRNPLTDSSALKEVKFIFNKGKIIKE